MGAALCSCGGLDDQGLNNFGYERISSVKNSRLPVIGRKYGAFPQRHRHLQHAEHGSVFLSRGETFSVSADANEEASDRTYKLLHGSAQAYADAFRAKLQEPPLSPRSKFYLLTTRLALGSSLTTTESSGESGSEEDAVKRRKERACNSYLIPEEDDESVTDEDWQKRANPLITIIVPPGPCGLVLQVGIGASDVPIVDGFVRKFDGRKSTIENSGLVHKGSELCAINDIDVTRMALKEVIHTLNLSSHLERTFTFRNNISHH
ncbi:hypothetical protein CCR75_004104 [Bremia lactucae]|uniref:PDZ domain-containing protein n=1 Tax=Bremia lactucae TaxID=4779 RepID=A0A976IDY0_BRELC|nr:hypothetical protein CCR75_004104 [Bremia lactucae]